MKLLVCLILILTVIACVTTQEQVTMAIGVDQPLEYRQGFRDGCDSGYSLAGHPYYRYAKDLTRYRTDELYREGWDEGCMRTKGSYEDTKDLARRCRF